MQVQVAPHRRTTGKAWVLCVQVVLVAIVRTYLLFQNQISAFSRQCCSMCWSAIFEAATNITRALNLIHLHVISRANQRSPLLFHFKCDCAVVYCSCPMHTCILNAILGTWRRSNFPLDFRSRFTLNLARDKKTCLGWVCFSHPSTCGIVHVGTNYAV